ncbi:MAG: S1 RNA-binding domain-containing protein [Anaerolineales bacterium]|nr:S1 RNA-binding domain-containing protein [Anaerolineales bacterium]
MEEIMEVTETPDLATPTTVDDLKPKMRVKGRVDRLELYGAFIDIGVGANALIHISQLGDERVNRVSDVLNEGDEVTVWIDKVDPAAQQIMVTMKEPLAVEWSDLKVGNVYAGSVTRLENFGAFINIGAEREGLVHISELSHEYVKQPSEVVKVGDEVQVQVLGFSKRKRRIDLSMKALMDKPEVQEDVYSAPSARRGRKPRQQEVVEYVEEEEDELPTAMEIALRRAMGDDTIDEVSDRRPKRGSKKRRREKTRRQQEELLGRTLEFKD